MIQNNALPVTMTKELEDVSFLESSVDVSLASGTASSDNGGTTIYACCCCCCC